jgi:hypothetical protein
MSVVVEVRNSPFPGLIPCVALRKIVPRGTVLEIRADRFGMRCA